MPGKDRDIGSPLLEIRLFGQAEVLVHGQDLAPALSKRALWILAILALREGKPIERNRLAGMIWPDSTDSAALFNFRQTLAGLRRSLGDAKDLLQNVSPRSVSLPPVSKVRVDVLEFDACSKGDDQKSLEKAFALYRDSLMPDCDEPFVITAREARAQMFLKVAERLATLYKNSNDTASAARVFQRVLAEDPYRETACRALMTALSELGDAPAALDICRAFRLRLRRELNTELSPETRNLYRSIRAGISKRPEPVGRDRRIPIPLTGLVGRKDEMHQVGAMLNRCRLVTLTGPGGVGKTRLSLAVAETLASHYLDGAFFVDLAPVNDFATIPSTIAGTLNIQEQAGRPILETLSAHLRDRELLLVLDNCEHLAPHISEIVETLLSSAVRLHVLATSRQSLGVQGELVWAVPPLKTPASVDGGESSGDRRNELLQSDAVWLFLQRSGKDANTMPGSGAELETIGSICRRLDGLPLAIELAAARTKVLSVREIESRLGDRFALLQTPGRTLARHQTLQACIEWSWDLLSADEQRVLMYLSVFRGGCSLEALEAVTPRLDQQSMLDLVSALADRSLIVVEKDDETTRYFVLETIRQFAEQKLQECGELRRAMDSHRDYFLEWAEAGRNYQHTAEERRYFEGCELEHDNLRAAIAWCHKREQYVLAVRMCIALSRFWDTCGHIGEGRQQFEAVLEYENGELSDRLRASAHTLVGWVATVQRDCDAAIHHYQLSIPTFRKLGNTLDVAKALNCLASAHVIAKNYAEAKSEFEESLKLYRELNVLGGVAMVYNNLAEMSLKEGDIQAARSYAEASMRENAEAKYHAEVQGQILATLSMVDLRDGRFDDALSNAVKAMQEFHGGSAVVNIPSTLDLIGVILAAKEDWKRAVRLLAASESLGSSLGAPLSDVLSEDHREVLNTARKQMSSSAFEAEIAAGRVMRLNDAVALSSSLIAVPATV